MVKVRVLTIRRIFVYRNNTLIRQFWFNLPWSHSRPWFDRDTRRRHPMASWSTSLDLLHFHDFIPEVHGKVIISHLLSHNQYNLESVISPNTLLWRSMMKERPVDRSSAPNFRHPTQSRQEFFIIVLVFHVVVGNTCFTSYVDSNIMIVFIRVFGSWYDGGPSQSGSIHPSIHLGQNSQYVWVRCTVFLTKVKDGNIEQRQEERC